MLVQYCTGNARRAIECCAAMDANQGYRRARLLLKERFGNASVISETWVNKVAVGPVIGARDKRALREMADDLRNCVDSLYAMNLLGEVSTHSVLLRIVQRLPFFLRNRCPRGAEHQKATQSQPRRQALGDLRRRCSSRVQRPALRTPAR